MSTSSAPTWTRAQVLAHRVVAQQLDRPPSSTTDPADVAVLDLGAQETGPDGALWALRVRGAEPDPADLLWAWSLRGAPHAYRRSQAAEVAAATWPWSEADAAKRVFDAAAGFRAAGVSVLDALEQISVAMREVVDSPTVKGEVSAALHERLPTTWQRWCRPCGAEHLYEQPFRFAALHAGLELEPGTSPPVLRRVPGWRGPAARVPETLDPVRAVLHLFGPTTPAHVAGYLDTPVAQVRARWPEDATEVEVDDERRWVLGATSAPDPAAVRGGVRLLGPYDLFLQARDRELVVPDGVRRKDLWRVLGRPGAILSGHEVVGTWRPRASGRRLRLLLDPWTRLPRRALLEEQAARLAAHRGMEFAGFTDAA